MDSICSGIAMVPYLVELWARHNSKHTNEISCKMWPFCAIISLQSSPFTGPNIMTSSGWYSQMPLIGYSASLQRIRSCVVQNGAFRFISNEFALQHFYHISPFLLVMTCHHFGKSNDLYVIFLHCTKCENVYSFEF